MTEPRSLPLADEVVARATHGAWCPKLCNHTCPVLRATGRSDAVPWSFHRTVADLADGRLEPGAAATRLVACSGCGACAGGCIHEDQDVPAQVRAGRAAVHAVGAALPAVEHAVDAVADGRSPYAVVDPPMNVASPAPTVQLVTGCRDRAGVVAAAVRVLGAAGESVAVIVPEGCCGGLLVDLGATREGAAARDRLAARLRADVPVVLLDPHCRPAVEAALGDVPVEDLVTVLHRVLTDGDLELDGAPDTVRWHEPCLLVDGPAAGLGPAVLAAAGALVELPGETHRGCAGGGLGLDLLDDEAAGATADQRRSVLAGPGPLVTGCAGAAALLSTATAPARHLVEVLDDLLTDDPESVA